MVSPCALKDVMKELKYVEKLQRDNSLLSLPQSLSQILAMVGRDDCSMDDLSDVILKDPGLTSRILKMANSSFYRQSSKISTVKQAVVMLGMMQVKCLALSSSVFQTGRLEDKFHFDMKELFGHFISVAIGCNMLAELVEYRASEEVFISGLLHYINKLYEPVIYYQHPYYSYNIEQGMKPCCPFGMNVANYCSNVSCYGCSDILS